RFGDTARKNLQRAAARDDEARAGDTGGNDLNSWRRHRQIGSGSAVCRQMKYVAGEILVRIKLEVIGGATDRNVQTIVGPQRCGAAARIGQARKIDHVTEGEAIDRVGRLSTQVDLERGGGRGKGDPAGAGGLETVKFEGSGR